MITKEDIEVKKVRVMINRAVSILKSKGELNMSTEIYYFSGTGNSLHVAEELQKKIVDSKLISIVSLLSNDVIEIHGETVGFVFPLHGMTIPIPVKAFIEKVNLKSSHYIFGIVTRGGTKSFSFKKIDKILKKKGRCLDSCFHLNMLSNNPKFEGYDIPTNETIDTMESEIQNQLNLIQKIIIEKKKSRKADSTFIVPSGFILERLVLLGMFFAEHIRVKNYLYSDEKCNGCGICAMVCPSQKIKIIDGKPLWQNKVQCYMCYACLNYCPQQSVQISSTWFMKSYTPKNGRYPHPYASSKDIANQK